MILNVNGKKYEIENWDKFQKKLLSAIGVQVEVAINKQVNDMRLVDTGTFKGRTRFSVKGNELNIMNDAPYAIYLEYGTYDYWKAFGLNRFPITPDPKKKDISAAARKRLPKGMQPFAPFRRVIYNQGKMETLVSKAVKAASR